MHSQWLVYAVVGALILMRSAIFVFWEQSYFNSNQAVIGLMGKHLAEGRAFPVFMYGQNYMLAVEAWLAAPLFLVAGTSVAALKLPLVAVNVAVAWLLLWLLIRKCGLSPAFAGLATLFFAIPAPGTAAKLLEASGGIIEPFAYVLLLWLTRHRPVWCGLILGFGFVHREFTIYGFASLLIIDAVHRDLFTRRHLGRTLVLLGSAAGVWLVVQFAARYGSAMGPGTTVAHLRRGDRDAVELATRLCLDWRTIPAALAKIVTVHWPLLYGTQVQPLSAFSIDSTATQGMPGLGLVLGTAMILATIRIVWHCARERRWSRDYDFCAYLVMVGALSVAGYVIARCGAIDLDRMRYEMLSILGVVGLAGWYLRIEASKRLRTVWMMLVLAWAAVGLASYGRLWSEYLVSPPIGGKQQIVAALDARGMHYARAEYRDAYILSFLSNERIIVATDRVRISLYQYEVRSHNDQAVRIAHEPCPEGEEILTELYFCPP